MKQRVFHIAVLLAVSTSLPVQSHESSSQSGVLGKVSFPSSCEAQVQPAVERAVAMLHSFWYTSATQAFRDILKQDPGCTIAAWGLASILMSNPLAGQGASAKDAVEAQAVIDAARARPAKTARERDYLEAVAEYYRDFANRSETERQVARARAYEALAKKYPDDDEAQIFHALYLAGTQTRADQTYAAYLKAAAVLEEQFRKHPDHPGVAHYLIHSYDAPPIAEKGLPAARRYASIAPAAPHALHMPSHIFTRVGAWKESADTNVRSMQAARAAGEPDEAYHAVDYTVYAYLQLAQDRQAQNLMEEARKIALGGQRFVGPYALAAMPARIALERGDWKEAAALADPGTKFPFTQAITHFARGLGGARSGDLALAKAEASHLETHHKALLAAKNGYWATETEVQRLALAAWIALAEGDRAQAAKMMRAAADLEDKNEKHIVTPGRVLPARELLGDMLLEMKQPREALAEYELSQKREPNRYRNYLGAARAAEQAGDTAKARAYYRKLVELAKDADSARPELATARQYAQR